MVKIMRESYIYNTLLTYIISNAGYFQHIVEEFFNIAASAHTKDEYEKAFSVICRRYMNDLTDKNVQSYLLKAGLMEPETIEDIKQFYIDNAGELQRTILSAKMQQGKKYTLVYLNEFGYPVADRIVFHSVSICKYAQFTDAVKMTFKRYRKRSYGACYFYDQSIAIYEGWHELKKEDTYNKVKETENVTTWKSKYSCFDTAFFTDMVARLGNPIAEYRNFKVRESDGKVFA